MSSKAVSDTLGVGLIHAETGRGRDSPNVPSTGSWYKRRNALLAFPHALAIHWPAWSMSCSGWLHCLSPWLSFHVPTFSASSASGWCQRATADPKHSASLAAASDVGGAPGRHPVGPEHTAPVLAEHPPTLLRTAPPRSGSPINNSLLGHPAIVADSLLSSGASFPPSSTSSAPCQHHQPPYAFRRSLRPGQPALDWAHAYAAARDSRTTVSDPVSARL